MRFLRAVSDLRTRWVNRGSSPARARSMRAMLALVSVVGVTVFGGRLCGHVVSAHRVKTAKTSAPVT